MLRKIEERLGPKTAAYWHYKGQMRYEFCKGFAKGGRVLDAGCGTGCGADCLTQASSCVVGVDKDEGTLQQARSVYVKVHFAVMDCTQLGLGDNTFDLVCSLEVLDHLERQEYHLSELKRVVKDKGTVIVSIPNLDSTPFASLNPYHVKPLGLVELTRLLRRFFAKVEIYGQHCRTPAMRLYRSPVMRAVLTVMAWLDIDAVVPQFLKGTERKMEKLLTGSSLEEPKPEEFSISKEAGKETDNLIGVCKN